MVELPTLDLGRFKKLEKKPKSISAKVTGIRIPSKIPKRTQNGGGNVLICGAIQKVEREKLKRGQGAKPFKGLRYHFLHASLRHASCPSLEREGAFACTRVLVYTFGSLRAIPLVHLVWSGYGGFDISFAFQCHFCCRTKGERLHPPTPHKKKKCILYINDI